MDWNQNDSPRVKIDKYTVWRRAEELGISRSEIAAHFHVTLSAINYRYKLGWRLPDAQLLATVLKCTVKELKQDAVR